MALIVSNNRRIKVAAGFFTESGRLGYYPKLGIEEKTAW